MAQIKIEKEEFMSVCKQKVGSFEWYCHSCNNDCIDTHTVQKKTVTNENLRNLLAFILHLFIYFLECTKEYTVSNRYH